MGAVKAILFAVLHVGLFIGEALVVGGTASSVTEAWCFIQQKYLCCKVKYLFIFEMLHNLQCSVSQYWTEAQEDNLIVM